MKLEHFEAMVRRMAADIPEHYLDGIASIDVSPKAVPHPVREHVFTMGECIPIHGDDREISSRVVLYHGSFRALAMQRDDFAWRDEAWETLLHELRHHLEWRARTDALEQYDWAAEQNFARHDGRPFDPLFFQAGERVDEGVYRVDDDVFYDRVTRTPPEAIEISWHGRRYRVPVPSQTPPFHLVLRRLTPAPAGDVVLVVRRKPRVWDLFRRPPPIKEWTVDAVPVT